MTGVDPRRAEPLTTEGARALAEALFTGSAGPAWASRNKRHRRLLTAVLGSEPTAIEPIESEIDLSGPIVATARTRQTLEPIAQKLITAFVAGDLDRMAPFLAEDVWALWPDGQFGRYRRSDVLDHLRHRTLSPTKIHPEKPIVYGAGDARSAFALGIPEALDELFLLRSVILYTFALDSFGRALLALRPDGDTAKLLCLPLPSVDDAWAYSVRVTADENDAVRIGDRFVRHTLLGHGPALAAMQNDIMPSLWRGDEAIDRDTYIAQAGAGAHRLDAAELIFGGTHEASFEDDLPAGVRKQITQLAKKMWRAPLDRLQPRLVETVTVRIKPRTLGPGEEHVIRTLVVRTEEHLKTMDVRERWRVAGVFEDES